MSESAYQLAKSFTKLNKVPEIRAEIVDRFKKDIGAGIYEVPIEELVNVLISKIHFDE